MSSKILSSFFFALLICIGSVPCSMAADADSTKKAGEYSLVAYAGGGLTLYSGSADVPAFVETAVSKAGAGATLRVMWYPDHRLRFGLETGFVPLYSYTIKDADYSGSLRLTSIPLMLVWSMPLTNRINVFAGYGLYILRSRLRFAGETVSSATSLGYMLAANYVQPVSDRLGIAFEVKYLDASETSDEIFSGQLQLVWKITKW